jgi:hypothetical protein
MTIERSAGIPVPLGSLGGLPAGYYGLPGGGYRGLTEELDALVAQAAEMLVAEYGCDIQIRFNSDRRSGGAFLMPESTYGVFGVGAGLRKVRPDGLSMDECIDQYPYRSPQYEALADTLYVDTVVRLLPDEKQHYVEHDSIAAALAWLRENVNLPRLTRVS